MSFCDFGLAFLSFKNKLLEITSGKDMLNGSLPGKKLKVESQFCLKLHQF
jgi:hypothetical protein